MLKRMSKVLKARVAKLDNSKGIPTMKNIEKQMMTKRRSLAKASKNYLKAKR